MHQFRKKNHVLACSALVHFFLYLLVPLCCSFSFFLRKAHLAGRSSTGELVIYVVFVFYLFFLLFHVIVSNFLFLFTKNNVKNKRTMHQFRKKNMLWFILLSFIVLFCIFFLSLFVVHFHFFFEKAHLASGTSTGEISGRSRW